MFPMEPRLFFKNLMIALMALMISLIITKCKCKYLLNMQQTITKITITCTKEYD